MSFGADFIQRFLRERGLERKPDGSIGPTRRPGAITTAPLPGIFDPPQGTPQRRAGFDPTEATPLPGIAPGAPPAPPVTPLPAPIRTVPGNADLSNMAQQAAARFAAGRPRRQFTPAEQRVLTRFGGSRRRR